MARHPSLDASALPDQAADALPAALLVNPSGHLSELAAHLWVDGEFELLPPDLRDHAAACPTCEAIVGDAALLALAAHEVVRDGAPSWQAEHAPPPVALPWGWLTAALALALVSGVPSAARSWSSMDSSSLLSTSRVVLRGLRTLVFSLGHAAERGFSAPTLFASAALLCGVGVALSIVASRRSLSSGELS